MKKLILVDHDNNKTFEQEVFLEGNDVIIEMPKPQAFWLGRIMIVDEEPELKPSLYLEPSREESQPEDKSKEEEDESKKPDNQSARDERPDETGLSEDAKGLSQDRDGDVSASRDKRSRKRKAT